MVRRGLWRGRGTRCPEGWLEQRFLTSKHREQGTWYLACKARETGADETAPEERDEFAPSDRPSAPDN